MAWFGRRPIHAVAAVALALAIMGGAAANTITGPSSSQSPYIIRSQPGVVTKAILTVGDSPAGSAYRMAGIPDGLGAFDNGDGTFTLLMNHELGNTLGAERAHGAKGAFVSKWVIRKGGLEVVSGEDLVQSVATWNAAAGSYNAPARGVAFGRFCSADLPALSAFYNPATGNGFNGRIYMNGEEVGAEGRAFAHLMSGTSYELPRLGKFSWENSVANPATGDTTVVAGTDDGVGGQVYFYIGTKTNGGSAIDQAGLTNGSLYSLSVQGLLAETNNPVPAGEIPFSAYSFGDVSGLTGAQLEAASQGKVTSFQRPEDGAWDPSSPNDFYFVTTASFTGKSRLWRVRFNDAARPMAGGTVAMLFEGPAATTSPSGPKMMDNLTINQRGQILIQEDPGNQAYIARIWRYDISTGSMAEVAQHDPERFTPGVAGFLTQDEESSGIIDASDILGESWFLLVVQAHYPNGAELVEGGQLLALHVPPGRK